MLSRDPDAGGGSQTRHDTRRTSQEVLAHALLHASVGRVALVTSFGADSVVLLHMVSLIRSETPVLFLDTALLFEETLAYQRALAKRFGLRDLRVLRAPDAALARHDPDNTLHQQDPDACCALRKTQPLQQALSGFDGWITGRKRFQGGSRATMNIYEVDPGTARTKINPLAHWTRQDVQSYITAHHLPRHPLVARGYPSLGCTPCTSPVLPGEDPRAGRWRGQIKTECGIHFKDGKAIRTGENA